jgi:CRP-like cAMP-binding protein
MQRLDELLAGVPVFAGLDADTLELLSGCARNVHFDAGASIFLEGEPADEFYVVRQGRVALEAHLTARGGVTIETLEPGEVLGWSWLFPPYRWHFDARALAPVRATAFDAACLRGKCADDPALGYDLMQRFGQVMVQRLQATRIRLLDLYGDGRG